MSESQILSLVMLGAVALMASVAIVLRFGSESDRKARKDSLSDRSPLGGDLEWLAGDNGKQPKIGERPVKTSKEYDRQHLKSVIEDLEQRLAAMKQERDDIQLRLHAVDHAYSEQQNRENSVDGSTAAQLSEVRAVARGLRDLVERQRQLIRTLYTSRAKKKANKDKPQHQHMWGPGGFCVGCNIHMTRAPSLDA